MDAAELGQRLYPSALLLFSPAALYVACRATLDVIEPASNERVGIGEPSGLNPHYRDASNEHAAVGRRAIAQWLPICTTTIAALLMRQPELAVTIIFASSIALLSMVMGLVGYLTPQRDSARRSAGWVFVAPAALLCLVGGFGGALNWRHAILLLIMGAFVFWASVSRSQEAVVLGAYEVPGDRNSRRSRLLGSVEIVLALVLFCIGGWGAASGALASARAATLTTPGLVAATVLAPLLVLPALAYSSRIAPREGTRVAVSALVWTTLLNLLVLLPIVILGQYAIAAAFKSPSASSFPVGLIQHAITHALSQSPGGHAASYSLIFPLALWRIDATILTMLGLAVLPMGAGRWKLERAESALLVLGFAVYLVSLLRTAR